MKEPKNKVKHQYFRINNNKDKLAYIVLSEKQLANRVFESKVSHGTSSWRSVFRYDKRTKTIRNFKLLTHVLTAEKAEGDVTPASFREWKGKGAKDQVVERQGHWIKNNDMCLSSEN